MLIASPLYLELITSETGREGELLYVCAERWNADSDGGDSGSKRFEQLVKPQHALTLTRARASGLSNKKLEKAPELEVALESLMDFAEGSSDWIVAEGAATRLAFQHIALAAELPFGFAPPILGADELGAIVKPTVGHRGISELIEYYRASDSSPANSEASIPLDESPVTRERGSLPTVLRDLWLALENDLLALPLPLLAEMNWLLAKSSHPLKALLKITETKALTTQFSDTLSAGKLTLSKCFKDFTEIIQRLPSGKDDDLAEEHTQDLPESISAEEVKELFQPTGPLAQSFEHYEERPEQAALAARMATALSDGHHLLAEAGTGVGKSLAYLAPAVLFAHKNNRPVIVSTHTKNLQSQLFHKDLKHLKSAMGIPFEAALLKGRPNYLCARKFIFTLQESAHELSDEDRAAILPVMTWATQTEDGDVSEMTAFSREEHPAVWERLHTVGEDCLARQCPFYHRCFVYKARGVARAAQIVVTNHALVFADLSQESGSLPPYQEIVFDEAHTLEDVATSHLACEVTPAKCYRPLKRLFRTSRGRKAGKGLLSTFLFHLDQGDGAFTEAGYESTREHILEAIQAIAPANLAIDTFFETIREWLEAKSRPEPNSEPVSDYVPRERGTYSKRKGQGASFGGSQKGNRFRKGGKSFGDERQRYSETSLRPDEIDLLREAKETIVTGLGRLRQRLEQLSDDFKDLKKAKMPRARELQKEISAQNIFLQDLISDLEFVTQANEPNYVFWAERVGRSGTKLIAAPLDLSELLYAQLFERRRSIIMTSATLSVRDAKAAPGSGFSHIPKFAANLANEPRGTLSPPRSLIAEPPAPETEAVATEKPSPKSFQFLKQRLGLSLCHPAQLDEQLEGSPFDYDEQCRLYIPMFLPEPTGARGGDFTRSLSSLIAPLAIASGGRGMVLFTSYHALNATAAVLRKVLAPEGITVLAQREDGSREYLLAKLKTQPRTLLLGTSSFWEGVDVQGEALSLLIIAKLPFAVFTDPIVQGRCEILEAQGKDPFLHFSVPQAILRLRQGFGRLIRSKRDRGVVVLCDKRVLTKRYGPAFLRSLPNHARKAHEPTLMVDEIKAFLNGDAE